MYIVYTCDSVYVCTLLDRVYVLLFCVVPKHILAAMIHTRSTSDGYTTTKTSPIWLALHVRFWVSLIIFYPASCHLHVILVNAVCVYICITVHVICNLHLRHSRMRLGRAQAARKRDHPGVVRLKAVRDRSIANKLFKLLHFYL